MSFSQQFQKLGLADAKAVRRAVHGKRQYQATGDAAERQQRLEEEKQQQVARQRDIQAQQLLQRQETERLAGIGNMLQAAAVQRKPGDLAFHVVAAGRIKRLWLAEAQYEAMCRGSLRLAYWNNTLYILPAEEAQRIALKAPEAILAPPAAESDF